jgi:tetratricopeptide (TPR) repeat protein
MGLFDQLAATRIVNKAINEQKKGNYAQAEELYREAYQKGMTSVAHLSSFTGLPVRGGKFDEALEVIKRTEKMGGLTERDKLNMHIQYAVILWRKGHLDHAIEILEADAKKVKNGTLYAVIGYLLIEKGDAEKALKFNQEALEYDDEDPIFLENLAQVYYRLLGDKENARKYFEKVLKFKPEAIDTNYFLSLYDAEEGNKEKARERLHIAAKGRFSQLNYATPKMIEDALEALDKA